MKITKCFPVLLALLFVGCGQGDVSALNEAPPEEAVEVEAEMPLPTDGEGEPDVRYTYLDAYGGRVAYVNVDGMAYFEGDIVLGTTEEMEELRADVEQLEAENAEPYAIRSMITNRTSGAGRPWPSNTMYYRIASGFPNQQRITDAIKHIQSNTNLRLVARTNQSNYVTFRTGNGCSSAVGMRGGEQFITLANGCATGHTIHEIGHAAGLWHEQSRSDRDQYVTIHWENITDNMKHNFDKRTDLGKDFGAYDYGSLMHYGRMDFSKNGKATMTPKNSSASIGQRSGFSKGDIAALNSLYPSGSTPTPAVPACSFSSKPSSIPAAGGTYSFVASCSNSPTSYSWTVNGSLQASKSNTLSYKFPANTSTSTKTFTIVVTATNKGGSGKATASVTQNKR